METLPRSGLPRTEMMKRVALFRNLKGPTADCPTAR